MQSFYHKKTQIQFITYNMSKKKEVTVEEKLRALYDLQLIDSRVDEIKSVRGELPLEIEDLEDEIVGLNKRLTNLDEDVANFKSEISAKKLVIEDAKTLVKKYAEQQKNVRNNREFNSLSKETEYQELEMELSEKRIKEFKAKIEQKNELIAATKENIAKQADLLKHKSAELNDIMGDTVKEEALLLKKSEESILKENLSFINHLVNDQIGYEVTPRNSSLDYVKSKNDAHSDIMEAYNNQMIGLKSLLTNEPLATQKLNEAVDAYKKILVESDLFDKKARIDKDVTISIYFNLLEAYFAQRKTIEAETVLAALTQIDLSNREKKFKEKYAAAFLELTNRMAVNGL